MIDSIEFKSWIAVILITIGFVAIVASSVISFKVTKITSKKPQVSNNS